MFTFLARLIVFMIAISVIRSVVEYIKRLWSGQPQARPVFRAQQAQSGAQRTQPAASTTTVLQQDPICGTYVAVDTSLKKIIAGRVYYFCSPECRSRFTA